jgi:hypothetical protein
MFMSYAKQTILDHLRCPEGLIDLAVTGSLSPEPGFFRFGPDLICFGACSAFQPASSVNLVRDDAWNYVGIGPDGVTLPFDVSQAVSALRYEHYSRPNGESSADFLNSPLRAGYYALRPFLPVAVRKHLQRYSLRDWKRRPFPHWPVDTTVEELLERATALMLEASHLESLPFIWFWPDEAECCAIMTHDVETSAGRDFCGTVMDLDDSFGLKASFQIVPERRYGVPDAYLQEIRERGFEINVQDLNHDGNLYQDRAEFLRRAQAINAYAKTFQARGFRAAVLYRNLAWLDALEFEYDMSVPNVAHLDPQRGGCCTVFPYFVGSTLEIPVTTVQDYSLFYILRDHSLDLWRKQIELIRRRYGLMSFLVHPDYVMGEREQNTFRQLLAELAELRDKARLWIARPGDVSAWWIQRSKMRLALAEGGWRVEGPGAERASVAYARVESGQLLYERLPAFGRLRGAMGRCA